MSYIDHQLIDDEYEEIELFIGQKVKYLDNQGIEKIGEIKAVDVDSNIITVLTGTIIKYLDYIEPEDLLEG